MADNPLIPGSHAKPLNPDGSWRGEWWRFLRELSNQPGVSTELASQLNALAARVQTLEDADAPNLIGLLSVVVQGSFLSLRGDAANPGEAFFYGTDETGAKGWYQRLLSTLADVDVTTPPEAGDALVYDGTVWKPGSVDTAVPFFVPDGQSYTVATNKQALFTLPIELEGDASLVLDGALVEVS